MRHDVVVVGGSFAGLSAATYVARGRRRVCVVDTGSPRNRFAEHSHGFLGQDGSDPMEMLARARSQVAAYPTVSFVDAAAVAAAAEEEGFSVRLSTGESLEARKLVLAFGISDELPAIPGLAERWGRSVLHCPYCHGYELSDRRRLGVLYVAPKSFHQALLIAEWGSTTLYLDGAVRGASIDDGPLIKLSDGAVRRDSGARRGVPGGTGGSRDRVDVAVSPGARGGSSGGS